MAEKSEVEDSDLGLSIRHVEQFIEELDRDHLKWYERQQDRHYKLWIALEVVSIAAPLLTTIFSGIASALDLFDNKWAKCVFTVLPALAVASSSMLARLGVREMESSRELGRQQFEQLLRTAKLDLISTTDPKELKKLHKRLIDEAARIDAEQHHNHHRITSASRTRDSSQTQ